MCATKGARMVSPRGATILRYESNTKSRSFLRLASGFNNCKKHKEEPGEGGTLQRIVDQTMHENCQYADAPQRAQGRANTAGGDREHEQQERQSAFDGPLRPVVMRLVGKQPVVAKRIRGVCRGPGPQ